MAPGPLRVTLRRPVPLDTPLRIAPHDGGLALTSSDGVLLASGAPVAAPEVGEQPHVSVTEARAARPDAELLRAHPFPSCFGCGPQRDRAEAVALHVGRLDGDVWATEWTPGAGLPHGAGGALASEILWTALDCPSGFAAVPAGAPPHVLGRIDAELLAPLHVGEQVVVVAWPLGHEGRKRWGASALLGAGGELRARARATWISLA